MSRAAARAPDGRPRSGLPDASLNRVEFALRVAQRFGLRGNVVPVKTSEVQLAAPRPLRGGLVTDRAAALLENRPLHIAEAIERFHEEWRSRER